MLKTVTIIASLLFFMSATPSFAAQQTEGVVTSANPATGELTLQSGQTFRFANGNNLLGILPGELVGVSHTDDGRGIATYDPHPSTNQY